MEHIQQAFEAYIRQNHSMVDDAHLDIIKPTGLILHFIEHYGDIRYREAINDAAGALQDQSDHHAAAMGSDEHALENMIHSIAMKQCELDRNFVLELLEK